MVSDERKMILGIELKGVGTHPGGWRHPSVTRERLIAAKGLQHYVETAKAAEAAKLDFLFLADSPLVKYQLDPTLLARTPQNYYLEPFTLASAVAPFTSRIGLVISASTTYNEPYNVARMLASIDHLSEGRAAWNIVTSFDPQIASNFSLESHPEKNDRYRRAEEFVDVVTGLWDSWDDGAYVRDQASGIFLDVSKMHILNYKTAHFQVRGPLNIERCPQGHPVLLVAGSSEGAKNLAARTADVMFTAQPDADEAREFYADVKRRMANYGRADGDLKILPGVQLIVGRTVKEAKEKHEQLISFIDRRYAISYLSSLMKVDLEKFSPDEPPPESLRNSSALSRVNLVLDIATKEGLTLGETAVRYADQYGHAFLIGDPVTIVDELERRFNDRGADGFVIMPTHLPDGLTDLLEWVVPEMRSRGLIRSDYEGTTFRENLKLPRPSRTIRSKIASA